MPRPSWSATGSAAQPRATSVPSRLPWRRRCPRSPRAKTHYQGRPIQQPYAEPDTFAANQAKLLLTLLAANVLAVGADLLSRDEKVRMSRKRFRNVLKSAARIQLGSRRVAIVIQASRAELWKRFHDALLTLPPARGSPLLKTLPSTQ